MNTQSQTWLRNALESKTALESSTGAIIVNTGTKTGRSTAERFVSRGLETEKTIAWGKSNQAMAKEDARKFIEATKLHLSASTAGVYEGFAGPYAVRVESTSSWHLAFASNMFRNSPVASVLSQLKSPDKTIRIFHAPYATPSQLGFTTSDSTKIVLDPEQGEVAIVGTAYAGEIKKSAFTLCNYFLPEESLFPLHASANCLQDGSQSSVLFGLSGTGKTTLSATPDRYLIGDDEIVWTPTGLSNLEGGCYAKLIDLSATSEPEIYRAVNAPGSILENVGFEPASRVVNFKDRTRTENTRGSYALNSLERVFDQNTEAAPPSSVVFLTADAFGALPAVARLSPQQAQYYFVSGYTAKVAGTEIGVQEPQATFSTCFGAPFMPRPSNVYAKLLEHYVGKSNATVWLLNTGWFGGPYGVGQRFPISVSRAILKQIQSGALAKERTQKHPVFGFETPLQVRGVEAIHLEWPSQSASKKLAERFVKNSEQYQNVLTKPVLDHGGPQLVSEGNSA